MNSNGEQIGGVVGYLKTLSRIVSLTKPKSIYIAWEGGGSTRRRSIYSDYKKSRKPLKLNRFYEDDIPDTEDNKKQQIFLLLKLLKSAPVCQLYVDDCEGDDVVSYLCRNQFKNEHKIIVSSDKDMYQLLNDNTFQYSLHRKAIIKKEDVFEEFRITAQNFALAKSIVGDASDNIPGIKGIGFKKLVKLYPMLGHDSDITIQNVIDYSHAHIKDGKPKPYKTVIENEDIIRRNWKLIFLNDSMISMSQINKLQYVITKHVPVSKKIDMMKILIAEGINDFDLNQFFLSLSCIDTTR